MFSTCQIIYTNRLLNSGTSNKPWLVAAVQRGDNMIFATTPKMDVLTRINPATGKLELSGFGKEYLFLRQNGMSSKLSY